MPIMVNVIISDDLDVTLPVDAERLEKYASELIGECGFEDADINIIFVSDTIMTGLNEQYKGREGTTDVLSFNLTEDPDELLEGEIYISFNRARTQSVEFDQTFERELLRLSTHGLLHLTGRVHDTPEKREDMERETEIWVDRFFDNGGMS